MMRWISLMFCLFLSQICYGQVDKAYAQKIDAILEQKDSHANLSNPPKTFAVRRFLASKPVSEEWIHYQQDNYQQLLITYVVDKTKYAEHYHLLNHALVYAQESEQTHYGNPDDVQGLLIDYYVDKGQLKFITSTGHGKTEDDHWNPEKELMSRYKKRIKQLQGLLKK